MINSGECYEQCNSSWQQCQSTKPPIKSDMCFIVVVTDVPRFVAALSNSRIQEAMFPFRHVRLYFAISSYQIGRRKVLLHRYLQETQIKLSCKNLGLSQSDNKFCTPSFDI